MCNRGGGERVASILAKHLKADLYVAKYEPENTYDMCRKLNIIQINKLPDSPNFWVYPLIRMSDALKFYLLKQVKEYDLLITSGVWSIFSCYNKHPNMSYIHSPNRSLYDLRPSLSKRLSWFPRTVYETWADFWTFFDQGAAKQIDNIITNSKNTASRISKYYGRDAKVLYPPVDIKKFYHANAEDYFLSVQRIMPEKRVDLQIRIFKKLPKEKLIIVGRAEYGTEYQNMISKMIKGVKNVEWIGRVTEEELCDLYAHCKAVIQTPVNEDFGMVPVEGMAAGKPCIAVNEGGMKESIIAGTGILVDPPYLKNFVKVINDFDKKQFNSKLCRKRAEFYSEKNFIRKIKRNIKAIGL